MPPPTLSFLLPLALLCHAHGTPATPTTTTPPLPFPTTAAASSAPTLLEQRVMQTTNAWAQHEHARQLTGTVGDLTLTAEQQQTPHRGGKCFDSFECSWYYHTRHPGKWGDCDAGTCLCEPGYTGNNCEHAPPANRFSCSDGSCYNPTKNGRPSEIRGGNLTITVVRAINLPDTDGFGVFGRCLG
jgi:hypothetical protein